MLYFSKGVPLGVVRLSKRFGKLGEDMRIKSIIHKILVLICAILSLCALNGFAVQVNDYNGLKDAVNSNATTIRLTSDINFGNTPLVITTNTILTSAGNSNFTIEGNSTTSPMLTFQGAGSTISNINFSSSTAANPAIFVNIDAVGAGQNYSTFTIDGVTFSYNTSSTTTGGGALNIVSGQGTSIINTTFSTNSATGTGASGGALYYQGEKGFTGENINAEYNTAQQDGGAIYFSSGTIKDSTFSYNTAINGHGGAIYASTITVTGSAFVGNSANTGGAIWVNTYASIKDSTFTDNISTGGRGGAVYNNNGIVDISSSTFENNQASDGGAIFNNGLMSISNSVIQNNTSSGSGGAIVNTAIMTISNTTFSHNNASINGGAISLDIAGIAATLNLDDSVTFSNNTAGGRGGAIYADNATINLNPNGKAITFIGNTDSSGDNDIYLNGTSTLNINGAGTINLHGGIIGGSTNSTDATINWYATTGYNGNLTLTNGALNIKTPGTSAFNNITLNSATLNLQNGATESFTPTSLTITGDVPLYIDVDLAANTADQISSVSGGGSFSINSSEQLNILTDSSSASPISITSATLNINENEDFYGPLYVYNLQQSSGGFTATTTGRLNPTISALPIAANSKVIANVNTVNSLYNRIDVMLSREYLAYQERNRLSDNAYIRMLQEEIAHVTGESLEDEWKQMVWFIPNAGYQKVDYGNDIDNVKNTFYGGLAGVDYPFWISDDTAFIPTFFMGYLGSKQKYEKTTLNNNSLALGGMLTFMKNFAILSAQAYITNGPESYELKTYSGNFDIFSFTASVKGELNLSLSDDIVMQPAFTAIYNYSNLQNYITANLAQIYSTRFHNFLLTPSLKLMISTDSWYPYVGVSYNFSEKQKGSVTANNLVLSEYKIKNFGEISVGIENNFFKNYSGYAQLSSYIGSARGVALQMGVRGYLN